jgi:hypothetical protein
MCIDGFLSVFSMVIIRGVMGLAAILRWPLTRRKPHAGLIFDTMRLAIVLVVVSALFLLDSSMWYHFIRGQQTIKLFVVYNVLEVGITSTRLLSRSLARSLRVSHWVLHTIRCESDVQYKCGRSLTSCAVRSGKTFSIHCYGVQELLQVAEALVL